MDKDQVRSMIQDQRMSLAQVAEALGVKYQKLASFCSKHRILTRKAPAPRIDLDQLRHLVEVEQLQQREAAKRLGCSESCVERWCRRLELSTQRTGPRSGEGHPEWKGGRMLVGNYWYVYSPDHPNRTKAGYMAEHRLVMEATLGRLLERHEVVHHRNGRPDDNRPENLEVFQSNAEHLREELTGRIPNWTPEGREAIRRAVEKAADNRRRAASHQS